jgi:hypothetical protein
MADVAIAKDGKAAGWWGGGSSCWLLCVLCFLCFVLFEQPFSYQGGQKLILAKAKLPTFVQS